MKLIFFIIILILSTNSYSMDGNRLYSLSNSSDVEIIQYNAYIEAVLDMTMLINTNNGTKIKNVCLPKGVSVKQIGDMVKKYLEANPELRHKNAASLVYATLLVNNWQCKGH